MDKSYRSGGGGPQDLDVATLQATWERQERVGALLTCVGGVTWIGLLAWQPLPMFVGSTVVLLLSAVWGDA